MLTNKPKPKRAALHVKKGDKIVVTTGQYKSEAPREVLKVDAVSRRVIVEGVNMRTRHEKPTQEGETGRIVTEEASLHASNVMLYSTAKKVASRVEIVVEKDGSKKRKLKKTGEVLD